MAIFRDKTNPVSKSHLKDCTILLCQPCCNFCMLVSELQEISKERDTGDFGEILDFGCVCSVQISENEEDEGEERKARGLVRHDEETDDMRSIEEMVKVWKMSRSYSNSSNSSDGKMGGQDDTVSTTKERHIISPSAKSFISYGDPLVGSPAAIRLSGYFPFPVFLY
jgi:hypothetical protein